jgi:hypothetical protein
LLFYLSALFLGGTQSRSATPLLHHPSKQQGVQQMQNVKETLQVEIVEASGDVNEIVNEGATPSKQVVDQQEKTDEVPSKVQSPNIRNPNYQMPQRQFPKSFQFMLKRFGYTRKDVIQRLSLVKNATVSSICCFQIIHTFSYQRYLTRRIWRKKPDCTTIFASVYLKI